MKKENSNADDLFKDAFDGLEVNPTSNNWDKISDELNVNATNQIKQKFDEFEVTPSSKNWDKIKTQLPYNLRLRRQLGRLSKIAAVLLIGMIFTMSVNIWKEKNALALDETSNTNDVEQISPNNTAEATNIVTELSEETGNFVFDLKEKNNSKNSIKEEEEDIMALLNFILDDSDDLADAVDESILESLLRPVEKLPMEGLVLVLPEDDVEAEEEIKPEDQIINNEGQDLTIKIPLVVVEENEIESMINLYEANTSHGTSPIEEK